MKKNNFLIVFAFILASMSSLNAEATKKKNIKYKNSGRIDFESLLVEGERKKPEMAVVTGNIGEKDSGLLKFRTDFLDVMADSIGEESR